jgi:hypothetical protein
MPVDDQLIERQRMLKTDRGARVQAIEVHRDGAIHGKAQSIITIPPVFDKGNIRMTLGGGCGHEVMIP